MNRPSRLVTATLAMATALSLAACGNDGEEPKANDKIAGAKKDAGKKTPSPSASPSDTAGRPEIVFPHDARNVFEDTKTGDPKKDAVLADNAARINSVDDAIFRGTVNTEALSFYSTGKALNSARVFIQGYIDTDDTWVGTTRYFDRRVTFREDGSAAVLYCVDESRSNLKNRKTNKVDETPTTSDSYVLYNVKLVKNAKGVWQTTNVIADRGAQQCQP